ncbi:MAG: hypothetical protein V4506_06270 [Bacteroidota bacterium]
MNKLMYSVIALAGFSLLFVGCRSNEVEKDAKRKEDSIKAEAAKPKENNANSQFATPAPDADYTGDYVDKYPNGIIRASGFFRFGQRHGQWMYFYENGIKWSDCFYDKGKKHGETIVYFPNGQIRQKGWYKNDLRDSLWFYYDESGKEIDKRAFRNNEETGLVN